MTGKDIIKGVMDKEEVTNAQLAKRLGVTQAVVWARLNNKSAKDMQLAVFDEMLNALGYELVIRKKAVKEEIEEIAVRIDSTADETYKKGRPRKVDSCDPEEADAEAK